MGAIPGTLVGRILAKVAKGMHPLLGSTIEAVDFMLDPGVDEQEKAEAVLIVDKEADDCKDVLKETLLHFVKSLILDPDIPLIPEPTEKVLDDLILAKADAWFEAGKAAILGKFN